MKKALWKSFWIAMIGELLFSSLLFAATLLVVEQSSLLSFVAKTAGDWITIASQVFFPASIAIWITFVNLEATKFGEYLRHFGNDVTFRLSFIFPVVLFALTCFVLVLYRGIESSILANLAIFAVVYSGVALFILVRNVTEFMRIYGEYRKQMRSKGEEP
jgi:hypothetical protein